MIVINGGLLIDPASGVEGERDLLIEGSVIRAIDKPGSFSAMSEVRVIDAANRWVLPGLIDLHVHLREPGYEWKETIASGAEAAVLGGYTTVCCMPNTLPRNDCAEITGFMLEKAKAAGLARVLPIGAITKKLEGKELAPLSELKKAGCVAFSDDGEPVHHSGLMRRALEWCLMLDVPLSLHEEDKHLSCGGCMNESALSSRLGLKGFPKVAEEVMIARDIELARTTGGRIHICHVSSGRSVELIRRAKNDGIKVTCEVTPHHLLLTEEAVGDYDANAKMSPPLREEYERLALIEGLADGTIDAVASDHAPHEPDTKTVEFAKASFGILGLQTSLPLLLKLTQGGHLTRRRAIEAMTSGPARCFGLEYGKLAVGGRDDLVVVDPGFEWTFGKGINRSKSVNSPFWDRKLVGAADSVVVDGNLVVMSKKLVSSKA